MQPKKSMNCFARKLGDGTGTGRMRSVLRVVEVSQQRWAVVEGDMVWLG